jgi:NitT/TauT family transport system permease protein
MRLSLSQPVAAKVRGLPVWLRYVLISIGLIIIWQLYVSFSGVSPLVVSSPVVTAQALVADVKNGQLPGAVLVSLQNLVAGMVIGVVLGLALASLSTFTRFGRDLLTVLMAIFSSLPGIAILPLVMLWFGLNSTAIIVVVVHSALWPIAANTDTGFRTIGATTRLVALNLGLSRGRTVRDVFLPATLPNILSGLRLAWAFSWRTVVGAEVVFGVAGSSGGLGWYINNARYFLNPPAIFAGLVVIAVLGILLDAVFQWIEQQTIVRWGMKQGQ